MGFIRLEDLLIVFTVTVYSTTVIRTNLVDIQIQSNYSVGFLSTAEQIM